MPEDRTNMFDYQVGRRRPVAPTIIIGLGGTGKEVLLRLRRRFFERFNTVGFPTVGYLWIDTDTRNINIDGQQLDHIMDHVKFHQDECVNAEIPGEVFAGYFRDQRVSPHIFSWLDPKHSALGQVVNGAGQVRPLGRLAFFHCHNDIRRKLEDSLAKVRAQHAIEEMQGDYKIRVDTGQLDVIILSSLAGGTGSGMFLDMAFMCREALPGPKITGYLLLPSVFSEAITGSEKIYANAYAALKELEYYSLQKDALAREGRNHGGTSRVAESSRHDFIADWENRKRNASIDPKPIPPPPFNTCYLIDNQTQGGGLIGPKDKSDLCDMIAENIFLNFSSEEISSAKDSVRSNLEQYLDNPLFYRYDEHGKEGGYTELFAQRFSAFGFSKLYVPVDRIRRACGYQLGLDLIKQWLERKDVSEVEVERRLDRELAGLGLRAGKEVDDFITELRRVGGERTFDDDIREAVNQWREGLLKRINTEKRPELYRVIPRLVREFLDKNFVKDDPRPEHWGTYVKTLEQNRERFIKNACGEFEPDGTRRTDGRILGRVKTWLKDDHVRLYLSIEYLKMLGKVMDRHVSQLYVKAKELADRRAETAAEDIKIKLEMVRDEESGTPVQRKSLRVLVEQICDRLREQLSARMNSQILGAIIDIINRHIKPYIGKEEIYEDQSGKVFSERAGLVLELWSLRDDLDNLYSKLEARFGAFEKVEEHLIYENLYQVGMFRDYYMIQRPEARYPVAEKLEELETMLLQHLGRNNPHDLRDLIRERGREDVLDRMEYFCYRQFQKLEVNADAMELFERIYPDRAEREQRIRRLVQNGSVWLARSRQAGLLKQITENSRDSALITISAANSEKFSGIYTEIESQLQAIGYRNLSRSTLDRADAVFLYTEYAGIPLAYIRNLDDYYNKAYLVHISKGDQLHIDHHDEKFTDLLIKNTSEIERILLANRALLVGAILRVVKMIPDGKGDVAFSYNAMREGISRNQPLGMRWVAVGTLARNERLRKEIETEIDLRRNRLLPEDRKRFYTLLAYHILDRDNAHGFAPGPFARSHQLTAQGVIDYYSPEHRALDEILKQEFEYLAQKLGSEEAVGDEFKRLYNSIQDFSEELVVDQHRLRILKGGVID